MGRPIVGAVLVLVLATGCREGLAFRQDGRVAITEPSEHAVVTVPFAVRWQVHDLPAGTRFALLVDRTPPPPGEDLAWLGRHDPACAGAVDCLATDHLRGLRVEVTERTAARVDSVPRPSRPGPDLHDLTVVLLDASGRRLGEAAATVTVEVDRGR